MPEPPVYASTIPLEAQRSRLRAGFGAKAERALSGATGAERIAARNIALFRYIDFLTPQECAALVALIDAACAPSPEFQVAGYDNYRTSSTCNFDRTQALVADIDRRIARLLRIPFIHGEALQGQCYRTGQHFRVHPDFFYVDQPYYREVEPHGGQRTWTAMIYLNEPQQGGATRFPYAEAEIAPKTGTLLAWNNMDENGAPNPWTFHEGTDVAAGEKYIVTKWFRERPWQ